MLAKIAAAAKQRTDVVVCLLPAHRRSCRGERSTTGERRGGLSREEEAGAGPSAAQRLREALVGYGFIALPMAFFLLFFIFPIGYAIYISRYDWGDPREGRHVGFDNYRELYHDSVFWQHAVRNTLVYTAVVVPLQMALGLSLARRRQPGDPRSGRSSARRSTSRRSRRPPRSRRSRSTSWRRTDC